MYQFLKAKLDTECRAVDYEYYGEGGRDGVDIDISDNLNMLNRQVWTGLKRSLKYFIVIPLIIVEQIFSSTDLFAAYQNQIRVTRFGLWPQTRHHLVLESKIKMYLRGVLQIVHFFIE